jgi:predicted transcriptional regulator
MPRWTAKEDAQIRALRNGGAELEAIAERFPDRSRGAVAKRVQHLIFEGQVERRGRARENERWTSVQDATIVRLRARDAAFSEIASHFPERTADAVSARIRHLVERGEVGKRREVGTRKRWSAAEDAILKRMRRRRATMAQMAAAVQRSVAAVNGRIAMLIRNGELTVQQEHRPWTAAEDRRIAQLRRRGKTTDEIAAELGRTRVSVERHLASKVANAPRPGSKVRRPELTE